MAGTVRELTGGRGPDSVIDAVGMEAHGSPVGRLAQQVAGLLPDAAQAKLMEKAGADRLAAFHLAIDAVRRGGRSARSRRPCLANPVRCGPDREQRPGRPRRGRHPRSHPRAAPGTGG